MKINWLPVALTVSLLFLLGACQVQSQPGQDKPQYTYDEVVELASTYNPLCQVAVGWGEAL